jgi:hypothetical protein
MLDNRPLLKEALQRAIEREQELARAFALAVLGRLPADGDGDPADGPADGPAEVGRLKDALVAHQHTVDTLKQSLDRLPEQRQTY